MKRTLVLLWALVIAGSAALADHVHPGYPSLYCTTEQAANQYVDLVVAGLGQTAIKMAYEDVDFKCLLEPRGVGPADPVSILREYIGPGTGKEVCMLELEYRDAAKTKLWAPFYMSICLDVLHLSDS